MKLFYYLKHLKLDVLPLFYFLSQKKRLEDKFSHQSAYVKQRVDYYVKVADTFTLPEKTTQIGNYKRNGYTSYYFDLKEFLHYFPKQYRFKYYFGDETHIEPYPTLFKARPIAGDNQNSVIFKLDKRRHFKFVQDSLAFQDKKDSVVFRGAVTQPHRQFFIERYWDHPLCNAGQTNKPALDVPWQKSFMSIEEQLTHKFILCLEGNDVASNLKWAMSSNSVVITPKMKFETWFMEGTLEAGKHYIEVKDDYSDFDEKIHYYLKHPEEAEQIIKNAHEYLAPFQDEELEILVCIKVLERYFELSDQCQ